MRIKIIACGVFEPELRRLAAESPHEIVLELMEAGLHEEPERLRRETQAAIERTEDEGGFEAIGLAYGLCGRGTTGLIAQRLPVIIPRAHDCLTIFLGSRAAYRKQFAAEPGTYYITAGWFEHKVRPLGHEAERLHSREITDDPRYPALAEKYGPERAAYIIHFHDSWKRNYTRAAFIDTGVPEPEKYEAYARQMAADLGWRYERLQGDVHLLRRLVNGDWEERDFVILRPGERLVMSGDERVFTTIARPEAAAERQALTPSCEDKDWAGEEAEATEEADRPQEDSADVVWEATKQDSALPSGELAYKAQAVTREGVSGDKGESRQSIIGLGIDAGGTYTDCVLYDLAQQRVIAKAKALTTPHNLLWGIEDGLEQLDRALTESGEAQDWRWTDVRLVALSTTLATNAIVEGKGGRPGAILMSPLGPPKEITWQPQRFVSGAMDIRGEELQAPDPDEIAQAVQELLNEGVDAFAVSGYGSVRNPAHEKLVETIIRTHCTLPIVCGHHLSQRLDYVARANTAILNARLLGLISQLLEAVKQSLQQRGIAAPLMIVKGDGSLVNEATARERPVETILSGPAASLTGARQLTKVRDGLVFDMGGTTTDSALLKNGLPRLHPEGARVGGWRTSVEAAQIATIGLGGDSHLDFNANRELLIGPRRVLPLCFLAAQHPSVQQSLEEMDPRFVRPRTNAQALEFFLLGRDHEETQLEARERAIVAALQAGPLSRAALARRVGLLEPSLLRTERLENLGFVQRAALTPTDLLHVTKEFVCWEVRAAEKALTIFAELYGASPQEIITRVKAEIVRRLTLLALQHLAEEAGYGRREKEIQTKPSGFTPRNAWHLPDPREGAASLGAFLLEEALAPAARSSLTVRLRYADVVIAVGAPVRAFFPEVARRLGTELIIPAHAEVANAIGAITSDVVVREQAIVRPGEINAYVVHTREGKEEYEALAKAVQAAKEVTKRLAMERAARAGAIAPRLQIGLNERRGLLADGHEELIEIIVEAIAVGQPLLAAAT